jgi:hypothetical protein
MGLDHSGVWHPMCDIASCKEDQVDDGLVEVDVLVGTDIRTARINVCAGHRDRLSSRRERCSV